MNDDLRDIHRAYLGAEQTDPAEDTLYSDCCAAVLGDGWDDRQVCPACREHCGVVRVDTNGEERERDVPLGSIGRPRPRPVRVLGARQRAR